MLLSLCHNHEFTRLGRTLRSLQPWPNVNLLRRICRTLQKSSKWSTFFCDLPVNMHLRSVSQKRHLQAAAGGIHYQIRVISSQYLVLQTNGIQPINSLLFVPRGICKYSIAFIVWPHRIGMQLCTAWQPIEVERRHHVLYVSKAKVWTGKACLKQPCFRSGPAWLHYDEGS